MSVNQSSCPNGEWIELGEVAIDFISQKFKLKIKNKSSDGTSCSNAHLLVFLFSWK